MISVGDLLRTDEVSDVPEGTPEARLSLLARLAAGLCAEARISRLVVSMDDRWSWNPVDRVMRVGRAMLRAAELEACAGIVAHEAGHAFLSRYHLLPSPLALADVGDDGARARLHRWMNAIEDPRVEAWMEERYPGVGTWLSAATRHALAGWDETSLPRLRSEQWALGACLLPRRRARDGEATGGLPRPEEARAARIVGWMLPEVRDTLGATASARVAYRDAFLPPTDPSAWRLGANDARELQEARAELHLTLDASEGELLVRLCALRAWRLARSQILPHVRALHAMDEDEVARLLASDPVLAQRVESSQAGPARRPPDLHRALGAYRRSRPSRTRTPTEAQRELARRWIDLRAQASASAASAGIGSGRLLEGMERAEEPGSGGLPPEARVHVPGPGEQRPPAEETPRVASPAVLVDRLERALTASLELHQRVTRGRHAHAGLRPDLRKVMANEGPHRTDPSRWVPAWRTPSVARHDAAFALLIDCSGSMRRQKIDAAVEAADVFVQALWRVRAPFLVAGFQDVPFVLAPPGCSLAQARRGVSDARAEVAGARPGGNNVPANNDDGPCLLEVAQRLRALPASQHVLVVLSDGAPAGRRSTAADLHDAVRLLGAIDGLDLIGIGLGAGATHVRNFYPRNIVVPDVNLLPTELVRVLGATRLR